MLVGYKSLQFSSQEVIELSIIVFYCLHSLVFCKVKSLVRNYAVDLALSSVFGVESDSFFKENATYTKFTKGEMFVDSNQANFAVLSGFFAPTVGRIFRWR